MNIERAIFGYVDVYFLLLPYVVLRAAAMNASMPAAGASGYSFLVADDAPP